MMSAGIFKPAVVVKYQLAYRVFGTNYKHFRVRMKSSDEYQSLEHLPLFSSMQVFNYS